MDVGVDIAGNEVRVVRPPARLNRRYRFAEEDGAGIDIPCHHIHDIPRDAHDAPRGADLLSLLQAHGILTFPNILKV
jgi:hypothetical protein